MAIHVGGPERRWCWAEAHAQFVLTQIWHGLFTFTSHIVEFLNKTLCALGLPIPTHRPT